MTTREHTRVYHYCLHLMDIEGRNHESVYIAATAGVGWDGDGYSYSIDAGEMPTLEYLQRLAGQIELPLDMAAYAVGRDGIGEEDSRETLLTARPLALYRSEDVERLIGEDMRACEEGWDAR
jgi:hypothetical protein